MVIITCTIKMSKYASKFALKKGEICIQYKQSKKHLLEEFTFIFQLNIYLR